MTVSLTGCAVKGEKVTAAIGSGGEDLISITPESDKTDADGNASFTITAKGVSGETSVTFTTEGGLSVVVNVSVACTATGISVSEDSVTLQSNEEKTVTISLTGCEMGGEKVTATINADGQDIISVTPKSQETDAFGNASFTITAKDAHGNAKVTFKVRDSDLSVAVSVTTKKN